MFREHFGKTPAKVAYQVRSDSNRGHDFVFLSSLIHDARFRRKDIVLRNKRLVIPIERDCWELGMVQHTGHKELYLARSRLVVSPVTGIKWSFTHSPECELEGTPWIDSIWLVHQGIKSGDYVSLILSGVTWECIMTVYEPNLVVRLQDVETPYLHSESMKTEQY